jgi:hypothetical protein
MADLRKADWEGLGANELLIFLRNRLRTFGQFDSQQTRDTIYFPFARAACEIAVTIDRDAVVRIEPGAAFDSNKWSELADDISKTLVAGDPRTGREFSFSTHRVFGRWRGDRSGIQILPPPLDAPRAPGEMAEHPFILEFPIKASDEWVITNYRRRVEHRKLTLLLNALLAPRISSDESGRIIHRWATVDPVQQEQKILQRLRWLFKFKSCSRLVLKPPRNTFTSEWLQQSFFANLGPPVAETLSTTECDKLEEIEPDDYYLNIRGFDGKGLRVPSDLDNSICLYLALPFQHREKFDRAAFWLDIASRQWTMSASASFASLVTAIETLTEGRGAIHNYSCPVCGKPTSHEVPGATRRFIEFFDSYAAGQALAKQRSEMYALRSSILHGSRLMELDGSLATGITPADYNEGKLQRDLWGLTNTAIRNWLKSPR